MQGVRSHRDRSRSTQGTVGQPAVGAAELAAVADVREAYQFAAQNRNDGWPVQQTAGRRRDETRLVGPQPVEEVEWLAAMLAADGCYGLL